MYIITQLIFYIHYYKNMVSATPKNAQGIYG